MTNADNPNQPAMLTIVVLARENTSYAFRRMMESLKAQTVANMAIWVLDGNVPGDAYSLSLQEDVSRMEDVRLLPVSAEGGIAHACNQVLEQVNSTYVGFVNSCDSWYPYKAERQLQEMEANAAARACLCNGYRRLDRTDFADSSLIFGQPERIPAKWLTSQQFFLSSQVIYRTESLKGIGGFDPKLETRLDQDAIVRMCTEETLKIIEEPLFDNHTAYAPDRYRDYQSLRYLLRKHYDILLRNRRQYFAMNMLLAKVACRCTLWLNAAVHVLVAVMKMPLYAVGHAAAQCVKKAGAGIRHLWRNGKVRRMAARLQRSLKPLRRSEAPAAPVPELTAMEPPETVLLDPVKHNRKLAFVGNRKLRSVVIPDHMTLIPYGMFAGCKNLEHVVIPATVSHIDACAFLGCERLRHVEIAPGSQLTHIADYAFAGCKLLNTLVLPCNINHMGGYAFAGCSNLSTIHFAYQEKGQQVEKPLYPAVLDGIAQALFAGCRSLRQVEFPEGSLLGWIGSEAFMGCASLHHVYLDGHIKHIGEAAFAWCTALEGFVFPQIDGVESIGRQAFTHCRSLTYFRLPYATKTITRSCFEGCLSLKYVKVPKPVLYIEPKAYAGCRDLEDVILISSNTKYAPNAFDAHTRINLS